MLESKMALRAASGNLAKIGLCGMAVYYSVVEGVWSTSDQSVGPVSKVKNRLLPQAFQFVSDLPYRATASWNKGVSKVFKAMNQCECNLCRVKKFFKSFWS
ncbi:hypothetical protein CRM22_003585 [Opisthorchis felineus]|uniref:MICOS complex subunit MIC13 n=1 Tax=Opisthorchis felineus TaxID=147828 RepID=A0A4S2M6M9_OPIFE|nr:hypothetical protein CRM22_003585 [Opisthorchis felineus]TGZ69717.1 hypothetical protein CRM22_003585 [Opisthorchis felineus]TGZ69718.1 hypothetical protein CRM22_003585 [Opisthorchis felineus]